MSFRSRLEDRGFRDASRKIKILSTAGARSVQPQAVDGGRGISKCGMLYLLVRAASDDVHKSLGGVADNFKEPSLSIVA